MTKTNYILIAVSILVIVVGFLLMTGSTTVLEYNPDIFSFRRITLAPFVCVAGFALMIVGIMFNKTEQRAKNKE